MESYPEGAQIEEFISESDFPNYPQMDEASLAFGIAVGIVAMKGDATKLVQTLRDYIGSPEGNGPVRYTQALELCDKFLASQTNNNTTKE